MTAVQDTFLWLDGANTTILHHGNGAGGAASVRIATTAGPFTFTGSSATDTNGAPWDVSTAVAGDIAITVDGYYGIFVSQDTTTAVAIVERWINIKTGAIGTPAGAASAVRILTGDSGNVGRRIVTKLRKIIVKAPIASATHTLYAGDQSLEVFTNLAGITSGSFTIPLDITLNGPVGVATSGATATVMLQYERFLTT